MEAQTDRNWLLKTNELTSSDEGVRLEADRRLFFFISGWSAVTLLLPLEVRWFWLLMTSGNRAVIVTYLNSVGSGARAYFNTVKGTRADCAEVRHYDPYPEPEPKDRDRQ